MGIPGFYGRFLTREVRQAIIEGLPPFVSSLSFDLNGVFHAARKEVFGEGVTDVLVLQAIANTDSDQILLEFYNAISNIILRMIESCNPLDCLILAVDGVGPAAKLQQQRGRREKAARKKSPLEPFDGNAITPGTEFMMMLDNFMIRFIGNNRNILPPKVIYSSHLVPGEGEHKIMDYYRRGEVSDGEAAKQGGAHILYGLDADLIMLSLLAPIDHIYLSRETVKQSVDIDKFRDYIIDRGERDGKGSRPSSVDDFVVMMFLLGNDFLPHSPSMEEMEESLSILMDIYVNGNYELTISDEYEEERTINWVSMKLFLQAVAERENELLAALSVKTYTYPSRFLQAALRNNRFYPEAFRSTWYQNALGPRGSQDFVSSLEQIIGKYVPNEQDLSVDPILAQTPITSISAVTQDKIVNMAINYMRTMEWIYLYYRKGTYAINQDWSYPHYHTPMLSDLAAVAQLVGEQIDITGYKAYDGMVPFTALHQLIAVLPLKSKDLLPIELQPLFSYNSIIRDLLPDNFIVELHGKNKIITPQGKAIKPQGVPIIPLIDRRRIIEAVSQITFTVERANLWLPAEEKYFLRSPEETEIIARIQFDRKRKSEFEARNKRSRGRGTDNRSTPQTNTYQRQRPQYQSTLSDQTIPSDLPAGGRGRGRGRGRGTREGREVDTYIPGRQTDTYIPGRQTDAYIPGRQTDAYIPGRQTDAYIPGRQTDNTSRRTDTYIPGRQTDIYIPGRQTDNTGRRTDTYIPGRQTDTYIPGRQTDNTGRRTDTYIPGRQTGSSLPPSGRGTRGRGITAGQTEIRHSPSYTQTRANVPALSQFQTQTPLTPIGSTPSTGITTNISLGRGAPVSGRQMASIVPLGTPNNISLGRGTPISGRQVMPLIQTQNPYQPQQLSPAQNQYQPQQLSPVQNQYQPLQLIPVNQTTRQQPTSPAQWNQLNNLM